MTSRRSKQGANPLGKFAAIVAISLAAGGIMGAVTAVNGNGAVSQLIVAVVLTATMAVVLVFCLRWWAALDEAAQEAHKWAWWWGGSAGMTVGLMMLMAVLRLGADAVLPAAIVDQKPEDLIYLGAMGMLACQMVGYGVAWASWWLRRR